MNFRDIPIKDIEYLLTSNDKSLSGNKYLTAWNLILKYNGESIKIPISIANWIIAYNLSNTINLYSKDIDYKFIKYSLFNGENKEYKNIISYMPISILNNKCTDVLNNISEINKLYNKDSFEILLDPFDKRYSELNKFFNKIINYTDDKNVIDCIWKLQKYSSNWYNILNNYLLETPSDAFLINPKLKQVGFNPEFVNEILFYKSGRPKLDMTKYLDYFKINPKHYEFPILVKYKNPNYFICNVNDGLYNNGYIPIIRYQKGMGGYLTTGGKYEEEKFCGTFYYYEPDSPYFLYGKTILVTWNKITACFDIGIDFETIYEKIYSVMKTRIDITENDEEIPANPNNIGFKVKGQTPEEQWKEVIKGYQLKDINYLGLEDNLLHISPLYAAEDALDQLLCLETKKKNIDLVIIKYMTGSTRIVSEVLDSRTRRESFSNIWFPPKFI